MLRWPFLRRITPGFSRGDVGLNRENKNPQAAYALWAPTYPPYPHNQLMAVEQQTMLSLLPEVGGLTVVDAGCGTGRYLRELRDLGIHPIGVDLSAAMIGRARGITPRLARADLCALPLGAASADVIVCGLALGDVPQLAIALSEMARVLRPGGCVVYSVVHPAGAHLGWSRTFAVDGSQFAVDGYWHSADEHRRACGAAGLRITAWVEPVLDEAARHPAVLVVRASR
jgi:malonyl-CoA O-methyltransferase